MFRGRPTVFLSCSEAFKDRLAIPVRTALAEIGVLGLIVSEEPLLPGLESTPDAKVDGYLCVSDAFVALCTPDDELRDGSTQSRQNIIDEIQRARQVPHLRHRTQVFKAASVRLPSNINVTYSSLDLDGVQSIVNAIREQLKVWAILSDDSPPVSNQRVTGAARPAPATHSEPAPTAFRGGLRRNLLRVLSDPTCEMIVIELLEGARTQRQLALELGIASSSVSRHMRSLEELHLVTRQTLRGPYELTHREQTWRMLQASVDLARDLAAEQAEQAATQATELRKSGMRVVTRDYREA